MDTNLSIKRTIYISCDTFGGFKRTIEINDCNSKQRCYQQNDLFIGTIFKQRGFI